MAFGQPVTDSRINLASQKVRFVTKEDTSVKDRSKRAQTEEKVSAFDTKSDADAVVQERFDLLKERRHVYQIEVQGHQFSLERGDTHTLKFPRFGLENGKDCIVLDLQENTNTGTTTVKVLV